MTPIWPVSPRLILNWVLLDEQFNPVKTYPQSGAVPVEGTDQVHPLSHGGIDITKNGYCIFTFPMKRRIGMCSLTI
jgi:hypothetical protein